MEESSSQLMCAPRVDVWLTGWYSGPVKIVIYVDISTYYVYTLHSCLRYTHVSRSCRHL